MATILRFASVIAPVLVLCAAAIPAGGEVADFTWNGSMSSTFAQADNWDEVAVPGVNDRAVFPAAANPVVVFDAGHETARLLVGHVVLV